MELRKVLFSPSKTTFLTLSNCFFHGRNYFFQKDRQFQRAGDLSLLLHLFHNHARARAAVGLSLALVLLRRNCTYTWYFVAYIYWFHDVYRNFKHAMRSTSYIVIMKKKRIIILYLRTSFLFSEHRITWFGWLMMMTTTTRQWLLCAARRATQQKK